MGPHGLLEVGDRALGARLPGLSASSGHRTVQRDQQPLLDAFNEFVCGDIDDEER